MIKFDSIEDLRNAFAKAYGIAYFPETDDDEGDGEGDGDEGDDDLDKEGDEGGEGDDDLDKLKEKIVDKKLAQENANRRRENRDLKAKIAALEDEKKGDTEKLEEQAALVPLLQQKNNDLLVQNAVLLAADDYEIKDRELLLLLVSKSDKVKIEDGEVEGIDEAIKEIKKKKPLLFGSADDKDDKGKAKESGTNGASGRATNENKDTGGGPDVEQLKKKYPALRGR